MRLVADAIQQLSGPLLRAAGIDPYARDERRARVRARGEGIRLHRRALSIRTGSSSQPDHAQVLSVLCQVLRTRRADTAAYRPVDDLRARTIRAAASAQPITLDAVACRLAGAQAGGEPHRHSVDPGDDRDVLEASERLHRLRRAQPEVLAGEFRPLHQHLRAGQSAVRHRLPGARFQPHDAGDPRPQSAPERAAEVPARQRRSAFTSSRPEGARWRCPTSFGFMRGRGRARTRSSHASAASTIDASTAWSTAWPSRLPNRGAARRFRRRRPRRQRRAHPRLDGDVAARGGHRPARSSLERGREARGGGTFPGRPHPGGRRAGDRERSLAPAARVRRDRRGLPRRRGDGGLGPPVLPVVGHHGAPEGPARHPSAVRKPLHAVLDEPRVQFVRPVRLGDAALFRRRTRFHLVDAVCRRDGRAVSRHPMRRRR